MADYLAATIRFPAAALDHPAVAAALQTLRLREADGTWRAEEVAEASGIVTLYEPERAWGAFSELEEALQAAAFAYDRYSDGKYESDCVWVYFRPGADPEETSAVADKDLQPCVRVQSLLDALDRGEALTAARIRQLAGMPAEPLEAWVTRQAAR